MKKGHILLGIATAAFVALASCTKDTAGTETPVTGGDEEGTPITFVASADNGGAMTRAAYTGGDLADFLGQPLNEQQLSGSYTDTAEGLIANRAGATTGDSATATADTRATIGSNGRRVDWNIATDRFTIRYLTKEVGGVSGKLPSYRSYSIASIDTKGNAVLSSGHTIAESKCNLGVEPQLLGLLHRGQGALRQCLSDEYRLRQGFAVDRGTEPVGRGGRWASVEGTGDGRLPEHPG